MSATARELRGGITITVKTEREEPYKFDPATFDPENNHKHFTDLHRLRNQGWTRLARWHQARRCGYEPKALEDVTTFASTAFQHIGVFRDEEPTTFKGATFLDLGCGESPDANIAAALGAKMAYRMDLFRCQPWRQEDRYGWYLESYWDKALAEKSLDPAYKRTRLILGDFTKKIPLKASSVDIVIAQAVLPLVHPDARGPLYRRILRVLKPGGLFIAYFCKLRMEWPWAGGDERRRCVENGFVDIGGKLSDGNVRMRKPERKARR